MTSPNDIVAIVSNGKTFHTRRFVADMWRKAGSPWINSAGRLEPVQQQLYDRWRAGWAGYYPADNPKETWRPLAHVRFVALDIDPTPSRVKALEAAGFYRPFDYEPWHWVPEGINVNSYPLVKTIPKENEDMPLTTAEKNEIAIAAANKVVAALSDSLAAVPGKSADAVWAEVVGKPNEPTQSYGPAGRLLALASARSGKASERARELLARPQEATELDAQVLAETLKKELPPAIIAALKSAL